VDVVAVDPSQEDAPALLKDGVMAVAQRIQWSSNGTFLVRIGAGPGRYLRAIYKPRDGERPLYDFPDGSLYKREYAAYLLSRSMGWPRIPPTVVRDGPYGIGAVQLAIESDPRLTYFDFMDDNAEELLKFAAYDVVVNNADRKAGHCILGHDGRLWSIDHGLTFHHEFKMRTVMLKFSGARIPQTLLGDIEALAARLASKTALTAALDKLITVQEMSALRGRIAGVLESPIIPHLDPRWNLPWPLV
jgi:uncharacterized repeat protein (TIGR03843 family)